MPPPNRTAVHCLAHPANLLHAAGRPELTLSFCVRRLRGIPSTELSSSGAQPACRDMTEHSEHVLCKSKLSLLLRAEGPPPQCRRTMVSFVLNSRRPFQQPGPTNSGRARDQRRRGRERASTHKTHGIPDLLDRIPAGGRGRTSRLSPVRRPGFSGRNRINRSNSNWKRLRLLTIRAVCLIRVLLLCICLVLLIRRMIAARRLGAEHGVLLNRLRLRKCPSITTCPFFHVPAASTVPRLWRRSAGLHDAVVGYRTAKLLAESSLLPGGAIPASGLPFRKVSLR